MDDALEGVRRCMFPPAGELRSYETPPPYDPTVALCLGTPLGLWVTGGREGVGESERARERADHAHTVVAGGGGGVQSATGGGERSTSNVM